MSDRIRLQGIEVNAHHGVYPEERRQGQRFLVDLELEADLRDAAASDQLADTIDYADLAQRVHQRVAGETWNLIERVAERVAELVLEDGRVAAVTVTVTKPEAPFPVPVGAVSVTLRRSR